MRETRRVFCNAGHASVAGDVLASRKAHGRRAHEPGWHRENYSSPAEGSFPSAGDFCMDLNAQEGQKMNFTPQLSEVRAIAAEKNMM